MTQTSTSSSGVTGTVRDQASQMNESVTAGAHDVAHEATQQARSMVHDVHESLRDRADQEASKLAQTLHTAANQMSSMADHAGEQSFASSLIREGGRASEKLASHIDDGGLERVMGDVRGWARRNPGGFLLGAAAIGFCAGRLARNLSSNGSRGASNGSSTGTRGRRVDEPDEYEYVAAQLSVSNEGVGGVSGTAS